MRAYLGFIPMLVVVIPTLVAFLRQALFYQGCMDGIGYILVAMGAFVAGGVLNAMFLLMVVVTPCRYFQFPDRRHQMITKVGFIGAVVLLILQLAVVAGMAWRRGDGDVVGEVFRRDHVSCFADHGEEFKMVGHTLALVRGKDQAAPCANPAEPRSGCVG
ncbi:hypothetical protein JW905_16395 [bacterium]|nr:hypothetical protein [candidate division CSSED10-310 bacterium]